MRVVIDTNILVSIIGKKSSFRWIFDSIAIGNLEICVSTEIILEYREILERKTNSGVAENISEFLKVSPSVIKTDTFFGLI
jgi:predicted nucleic acid-binding protein